MNDENFYDTNDEAQKTKSIKESELQRMRLLDDVRWVLSTPKGRRVIWWIWSICGTFSASYVPKDSNQTAFREGERNIGLQFLSVVNQANSEAYSQMQKDNLAEAAKKKKKQGEINE